MSRTKWVETLVTAHGDGPTLTAAAEALCIRHECLHVFPPGFFEVGVSLRVRMQGIISCAVTTPGTAKFKIQIGAATAFDGGAMPLNIVAKTNVPWLYEALLTCREVGGTVATNDVKLWSAGRFESEAVVGSPLPTVGGSGVLLLPFNASPSLMATGFDNQNANQFAVLYTPSLATASMTVQQFSLEALN